MILSYTLKMYSKKKISVYVKKVDGSKGPGHQYMYLNSLRII